MRKAASLPLFCGVLSALLLLLPFSIAGPVPVWRTAFGWVALVPLMYAVLNRNALEQRRYLGRSVLAGYLTGVLWYMGNCYWVYQTMYYYGNVPPAGSFGILVLYSLVLGMYFALFAFLLALVRKTSAGMWQPLLLAPFAWAGIDLLAARFTSVPWDQLGYSQIDNFLLTRIAPFAGVYGISFVLVAGNALIVAALLARTARMRLRLGLAGVVFAAGLQAGCLLKPPAQPTQAIAVLVQPNLNVSEANNWVGPEWDQNLAGLTALSARSCGPYIAGMPETAARIVTPQCPVSPAYPAVVAWPESPAHFRENDSRFHEAMKSLADTTHAVSIIGINGLDIGPDKVDIYNSAQVISPQGDFVGRYDKIHLVPFGEYIPYRDVFFFAHKLTAQLIDLSRGKYRSVFRVQGHRYGAFICYESIFADEVRQFPLFGAEVLVNISDDGWYGDTSAPWQHLNMARMRAVENRRWLLRDANDGVTAVIDPYGRITASIPRHVASSLAAPFGYRTDTTFYTEHGDLFAMLCAIIAIVVTVRALKLALRDYRRRLKQKTGLLH